MIEALATGYASECYAKPKGIREGICWGFAQHILKKERIFAEKGNHATQKNTFFELCPQKAPDAIAAVMFIALVRGIVLCLTEALGATRARQFLVGDDLKQNPARFVGAAFEITLSAH